MFARISEINVSGQAQPYVLTSSSVLSKPFSSHGTACACSPACMKRDTVVNWQKYETALGCKGMHSEGQHTVQ